MGPPRPDRRPREHRFYPPRFRRAPEDTVNVLERASLTGPERETYEAIEKAGVDGLSKRDLKDRLNPECPTDAVLKTLTRLGFIARVGTSHRYAITGAP